MCFTSILFVILFYNYPANPPSQQRTAKLYRVKNEKAVAGRK